MTPTLRLLLLGIVCVMIATTVIWQSQVHFDLDSTSFLALLVLLPIPVLGGLFYTYVRPDDRIAAMLWGYAFLVTFSPVCSLLTYFAIHSAGTSIDGALAAIDRAMGFYWPALMVWIANHPLVNVVLAPAYHLSVWQILLIVGIIGFNGEAADIGKLCLSIAICGLGTLLIWAPHPAFGAIAVYGLPTSISSKLALAVDADYTRRILELMKHGPGLISSTDIRGVIGFPSFHAQEAIVGTWYMRKYRYLFPPVLVFNLIAIAATPIEGGHHLIDVIAGIALAAAAIMLSGLVADAAARHDARASHAVPAVR